MPRKEVIVLGAGIIGVTTAYALARRGHKVTIVDRSEGAAAGASYANGAQLSYANTDALASPAILKKIPRLLLGCDPAFRLGFSSDPDFLRWAIRFLRNCTERRSRQHTIAGLVLSLESRLALHRLLEEHPIEFAHATPGKMHLYFDDRGFESACRIARIKRANGFPQDELTRSEAASIEPAVLASRTVVGAIYSPQDEVGDAFKFCNALLGVLLKKYGVVARFNYEVAEIGQDRDSVPLRNAEGEVIEGNQVVICAGIDSARLLKPLGVTCTLWPMKGYSFTAPAGQGAPRISITDTSKRIVFCPLSGKLRVAGLAELGEWSSKVTEEHSRLLIELARASLPYAAAYEHIESVWAGTRAMTPSSLPMISRVQPRVLINTGHGMLGWTYAMGSAERIAGIVESPE